MSSDISIIESTGPGRQELSVEVKAGAVGISIWDDDDYRAVWFDMTLPEHRSALHNLIDTLTCQLNVHETTGK